MVMVLVVLGAVGIFALLGSVAFAQTPVDITSFPQWASNPTLFVAGVVALVYLARTRLKVDGKIEVLAFAFIIGGILGLIFQVTGMLAVDPFISWQSPFGGIAYGFAGAVTGFLGVNVFDFLSGRHAANVAKAAGGGSGEASPPSTP